MSTKKDAEIIDLQDYLNEVKEGEKSTKSSAYEVLWAQETDKGSAQLVVALSSAIGGPDEYNGLIKLAFQASKLDLTVFVQGMGGNIDGLARLLSLYRLHRGLKLTTVVEGPAYSAHGILALQGQKIVIMPGAFVMLHGTQLHGLPNMSASNTQKLSNAYIDSDIEILQEYCSDVVDEQEILDMSFNGTELYLDRNELIMRLGKRYVKKL